MREPLPVMCPSAQQGMKDLQLIGVVTFDGARVRMTPRGRPYLRAACLAFDAYFEPAAQRHSRTV